MAIAAAKERQQQEQKQRLDLRSPDTKDAALHPRKLVVVNAPGATATDSQAKSTPVAPGQPTWAVNPKPLTPPAQPATATASDDGTDWVAIGAGVGLTLLVFGGVAAFARNRPLPTRAA